MKDFTFITGNKNKIAEYAAMLGSDFTIKATDLDITEIQSMDLEEVAKAKAKTAYELVGSAVVVDDTGFFLDHIGGLPGPFVAYFEKNCPDDPLIRLLGDAKNRKGIARVCMAYHSESENFVVTGEVQGTVTHAPRGNTGFGFDSVFVPDGHSKTFGEMTLEEKNKISHRHKALEAFKAKIQNKVT